MSLDWQALEREFQELSAKLLDVNAGIGLPLGRDERANLAKRVAQLDEMLSYHRQLVKLHKEIVDLDAGRAQGGEMRELYEEELGVVKAQFESLHQELRDLIAPPDERDKKPAFIEIRAGAGGQESSLFVADLYRMYNLYAQRKGWMCSLASENSTDVGGYRELVMHIVGKGVFAHFKHEAGVHRVQRVPTTETQGRIHTSTVTVAVMPEPDEVDLDVKESDLRIDTYRSSGAGGQHVNTTDSAVRITHIPTGVVVTCQDERSQIKNRAKALKMLRARLYEAERARLAAERSSVRKEQVGTGERSEKVRTYNFPQNRITDHRIDLTLKKLDMVMDGDLDDVIQPLIQAERDARAQNVNL